MNKENLVLQHVTLTHNGSALLSECSLTLFQGDILGLIAIDDQGLNAFIDLIIHNHRLDRGHMYFKGIEVSNYLTCSKKPNKAILINSKSSLFQSLSITDNFFFCKEKSPYFVNRKKQEAQLRQVFEKYGFSIEGKRYPSELTVYERCCVELIKATSMGNKVIIVKDPSSFLNTEELQKLKKLIIRIAESDGTSFIYLCNHHREMIHFCNRLTEMHSGTFVLHKRMEEVTPEMLSIITKDYLKTITGLDKLTPSKKNQPLVTIQSQTIDLSVYEGECFVIIDSDNVVKSQIQDALFHKSLLHRNDKIIIQISGKEAFKIPSSWTYLPENPLSNALFYNMSYVDNLVLRNGSIKLPKFWVNSRFRKNVIDEYTEHAGLSINASDLYELQQQDLYKLIYQRILLEKPDVIFIQQPFSLMDMYQRIKVLEYLSQIQRQGTTIIIIATTPSDSLKIASRMAIIQNGKVKHLYDSDSFEEGASLEFPYLKKQNS